MVDFNSEGAFSANKGHILELIILGRRDELINTFQMFKEKSLANVSDAEKYKYKFQSVLVSLFLELDRTIYRKLGKVDYDDFKKIIMSGVIADESKLTDCFFKMNAILDELNLIKIDTKKKYDTTDVESENEEKGL